jgi:hypothetical protein
VGAVGSRWSSMETMTVARGAPARHYHAVAGLWAVGGGGVFGGGKCVEKQTECSEVPRHSHVR